MGIFKTLFGRKPEKASGWKIKPVAERPVAWSEPRVKGTGAEKLRGDVNRKQAEPNPFLDDVMLDTIQLEADTLHEDNPYQSHSWEMDPENDTRKLRTVPYKKTQEKSADEDFNPYDTGEFRRGWKD